MDGIAGIYSSSDEDLAHKIFLATGALQHRGKACAGIAVGNHKGIHVHKNLGRIGDVVSNDVLGIFQALEPVAAIGNVGYTKNKYPEKTNAEPISIRPRRNSRFQVVLAIDGYLVNEDDLKSEVGSDYLLETHNKTEVIGALLHRAIEHHGISFNAGKELVDKLHGRATFALTALVYDGKDTYMISLNDSRAFEPFCYGTIDGAFAVSSESCSHARLGGSIERAFDGAEMTISGPNGVETSRLRFETIMSDVFQAVYFGNVASMYNGVEIFRIRELLGQSLVETYGIPAGDIIIPNPESGWGVTMGIYLNTVAKLREEAFDKSQVQQGALHIKSMEAYERLQKLETVYPALVKLAQAVRTFQESAARTRSLEVGLKFGGIASLLKDRIVTMGDDSIVRGTVSEGGSVWAVYQCGARELEFWVSYGPMLFPSFKEWHRGEDCLRELAVQRAFADTNPYGKSIEEINEAVAKMIGVDRVMFNNQNSIARITGPGSFQALDASYPIDEQHWPKWLRREVKAFHQLRS